MGISDRNLPLRFVVHHLHPISARLRFLKSSAEHVIYPEPLPARADLLDQCSRRPAMAIHPASFLRKLCATLSIAPQQLVIVNGFRLWIDTPDHVLPLYLVKVVSEQPFDAPKDFHWIELPDCCSLPQIERLVLRRIYDFSVGNEVFG